MTLLPLLPLLPLLLPLLPLPLLPLLVTKLPLAPPAKRREPAKLNNTVSAVTIHRHKRFGYRAVVYGWDRRPAVDVSDWDGVADLQFGANQPFFHCIPDIEDTVRSFGSPRDARCSLSLQHYLTLPCLPFARYVAQENLELVVDSLEKRVHHPWISQCFEAFAERGDPSNIPRKEDACEGTWIPVRFFALQIPIPARRTGKRGGRGA
jgi:heat shock protein HspQ